MRQIALHVRCKTGHLLFVLRYWKEGVPAANHTLDRWRFDDGPGSIEQVCDIERGSKRPCPNLECPAFYAAASERAAKTFSLGGKPRSVGNEANLPRACAVGTPQCREFLRRKTGRLETGPVGTQFRLRFYSCLGHAGRILEGHRERETPLGKFI